MVITSSGAAGGSASTYIQPDDISRFITNSASDDATTGAIVWPTSPGGYPGTFMTENTQVTDFEDQISRYRTTAVKICGKYIGPTGSDQGLIYLKSGSLDPFELAAFGDLNNVLPTNISDLTMLDFTCPLREGFEIVLQPLDPTSRRYRSTEYLNSTDADLETIGMVRQLQTELGDQWPWLVVSVRGGNIATSVLELEIVVDYEFQLLPGSIASRSLKGSPPDDPAARAAVGNAYRKLVDMGANVASRAAVTAQGGMESFLSSALSAGGRLLGQAVTGAGMLMMSRLARRPVLDVDRPSLRIQEL